MNLDLGTSRPYITAVCLCCLALFGCVKVGPDYLPPDPVVPEAWNEPGSERLIRDATLPATLASWWTVFGDSLLTRYLHLALDANLDLAQARSRLSAARASRDMTGAGLWPVLAASGTATRQGSGDGSHHTGYGLAVDAAWELDLFGGTARAVEAAEAQVAATDEALHDTLISLFAEVALNYIDIRAYQERIRLAKANLAAQEESLTLSEARLRAGLVSELSVQQARYLVASTRAQLPVLQAGFAKTANLLATLLGQPPGMLAAELAIPVALPSLPDKVALGIPAAALQRRPDVRQAERLLAARVAGIGEATAARYPSIKLIGSLGLEALSLGRLVSADSSVYSLGPRIGWTLVDGGAVAANIRLQSARADEALAAYKAKVLAALEEVENCLIAFAREEERLAALGAAVDGASQAAALAELQYQAGLSDFGTVLEARRSLLSFQDQQAVSQALAIGNCIRLYKALGGGWDPGAAEQPTPSDHGRL